MEVQLVELQPLYSVIPWGPILGVASTLLGGLFGRKKQKQPTRVLPSQIRDEAIAGGFNPLTVLRASAGGGFGMNPGTVPALSSMGVIAQAMKVGGDAISRWDPIGEETRELENTLLREQIGAAVQAREQSGFQSSDISWPGFGGVPKLTTISDSPMFVQTASPFAGRPKQGYNEDLFPVPRGGHKSEELTFPVFSPDGTTLGYVAPSWAREFKLERYQRLNLGHVEEMAGDFGAVIYQATNLPGLVTDVGPTRAFNRGGETRDSVMRRRIEKARRESGGGAASRTVALPLLY